MASITVQRQCWQRWPRVLIAERRNDDGTREERRYVPEGMPENEWKSMCRKLTDRNNALMRERDERANDSFEARAELERKQAEVDGLQWAIEEREALIRDLLHEAWVVRHDDPFYAGFRELGQRPTFEERASRLESRCDMGDWILDKALRENLVVKAESFPKSVTVVKPCSLENGVDFAAYVPSTALDRACQFIADYGSCPYDTFDLYEPWDESCYQKCSADIDRAECWRRYFEKGNDSR